MATNGFPLVPPTTMASMTEVPQGTTSYPELDSSQLERLTQAAPPVPNERVQEILTARSTAAQADAEAAAYEKRRKAIDDQVNSFWPTAIAVAAMASGNFGPMWQLQEQKRQTKIAALTAPTVTQAIKLSQQGEIGKAEAMMSKLIADIGDRAPEFVKAIAPIQQQMNRDNLSLRDMKADLERLDMEDIREGTSMWNFRENLRHNVKFNIPVSRENYAAMREKSLPHLQMINDALRGVSQITGRLETEQPLKAVIPPTAFNDVAGLQAVQEAGVDTPQDLVNIANMLPNSPPIVLPNGKTITYGDQNYQRAMVAYENSVKRRQAEKALAALPTPPEVSIELEGMGISKSDQAMGRITPAQTSMGNTLAEARKKRIAIAPIEYAEWDAPSKIASMGFDLFDARPGETFGNPVDPRSLRDFANAGGTLGLIDKSIKPEFTAAVNAFRNLQWGEDFWNALDNPTRFQEVLTTGTLRLIQDRLRIKLDPNKGIQDAAEAIVDKAIEQVFSSLRPGAATQDSAEIQRLKDSVKGKFTDSATGRQAIAQLQVALRDRITGMSGRTPLIPPAGTTRGTTGQQQTTGQTGFRGEPGTARNEAQRKAVSVLNQPGMNLEQAAETAQQQGATTTPATPTPPTTLQNVAPPGQRRRLQLTR